MIVDIIARAPEKVNAFISALLEIARRYSVGGEHFYLAALRAYQELRNNYIEEVEAAVEDFRERTGLGLGVPVREAELILYLSKRHQIRVDLVRMEAYPELSGVRSVWNSRRKILYLHPDLNEHQRVYQLCKACGFAYLGLKNRPDSSFVDRIQGFEGVLDNYLAAYFAVALLLSRRDFEADTRIFLQERTWNPGHLDWMLQKYQVSPEVLFQRFNLITVQTPLTQVFFMRMFHDLFLDQFTIDKELHLGRRHTPHSSGLKEHYCRRWLPVELLRRLQQQATSSHLSGVQRVTFKESGEVYLLLSIAKSGQPFPNRNICTTIGILVDETCRGTIGFWDDEGIPEVVVNVTCERCSLSDCLERAAPPLVVESRERRRKLLESIKELSD
jgi:predicted transcriptional regulator